MNSDNASLIYATLQTLHGFLDWIPIGYVFENDLIELITVKVCTYFFIQTHFICFSFYLTQYFDLSLFNVLLKLARSQLKTILSITENYETFL